jgi:hypothetical protein
VTGSRGSRRGGGILTVFGTVSLLAGLVDPGSAMAAEGSPVSSDPIFQAVLVDGRALSGRIVKIDAGAITLAAQDGAREELPIGRLVKLTRETAPWSPATEDAQAVILADGDRLMRVAIDSATDATLVVRSEFLGKLEIPLDGLLGMILAAPGRPGAFEERWDRILTETRSTEVIWLANGDRLAGSFLAMDERKIKIQVDEKPVEVERAGAVSVGFDPGLVNYPRPKADFLEVTLTDGTRLGITAAGLAEGSIHATTRFGPVVHIALEKLARVDARNAAVVPLSQRQPEGVRYISYVGPPRAFRVDRTVDGHPFQLAGQTYDRGLGTQSRTLLAYRIEPGDRRFQALVGVDERAGPPGSVAFRVFVDSQERFKTGPLTDRDFPKAVDIDLTGGKLLILATEFGERGDARDLADWVEARIIR